MRLYEAVKTCEWNGAAELDAGFHGCAKRSGPVNDVRSRSDGICLRAAWPLSSGPFSRLDSTGALFCRAHYEWDKPPHRAGAGGGMSKKPSRAVRRS